MCSVLPRAAQSISQYPLISCHFPKPNIKFPLWSESNKSPRRELAALMKKPEVKMRSGHLPPLLLPALSPAVWASAAPQGPLCSLGPEKVLVWLPLLWMCVLFILFASVFLLCFQRNRCGCFSFLQFYTSESFWFKSVMTADLLFETPSHRSDSIVLTRLFFVNFSK